MKSILAIINPISGTGSKASVTEMLYNELDPAEFHLDIEMTKAPGHAIQLAQKAAASGYYGVIAIGGDGTVNEVASGLHDTDTALGIIPCGSGNGLARHLGIPVNAHKAINIIKRNFISNIDYCTVNDKPFFCTCGVGFDAQVSAKFAESSRRGPLTYLQSALVEYKNYNNEEYTLCFEDKIVTDKAFLIACGNAAQYGNNAFIAPNASISDGLIDVTVIHTRNAIDAAFVGLLLFTKHLDRNINIDTYRTSSFIIKRKRPGVMHLDGDPVMMDADLHIQCHAKGLKVFTPAETTPTKFAAKMDAIANRIDEALGDQVENISTTVENVGTRVESLGVKVEDRVKDLLQAIKQDIGI